MQCNLLQKLPFHGINKKDMVVIRSSCEENKQWLYSDTMKIVVDILLGFLTKILRPSGPGLLLSYWCFGIWRDLGTEAGPEVLSVKY